jgi:hypothetical protein
MGMVLGVLGMLHTYDMVWEMMIMEVDILTVDILTVDILTVNILTVDILEVDGNAAPMEDRPYESVSCLG